MSDTGNGNRNGWKARVDLALAFAALADDTVKKLNSTDHEYSKDALLDDLVMRVATIAGEISARAFILFPDIEPIPGSEPYYPLLSEEE